MYKEKLYRVFWMATLPAICLMLMFSLPSAAGQFSGTAGVESPAVLSHCPLVSDQELNNIRGRYDTYYFGLDIIINLTGSGTPFAMTPHSNMPPGTVINQNGISFKDPNVVYQAGIGRYSIFQSVRVTGDEKIVTGVVNLDITIPKALITGGLNGISLPKGSQIGLVF